jgi:hypothetical protein
MMQSAAGITKVASMFNVCPQTPLDDANAPNNVVQFNSAITGLFPVQGNDVSCDSELCNIGKICDYFTSSATTATPLLALQKFVSTMYGGACIDADWQEGIRQMSNTTWQQVRGATVTSFVLPLVRSATVTSLCVASCS